MKPLLTLILMICISTATPAQQTWKFGGGAGVTFTTTPPSAVPTPFAQSISDKGTASVCDATGQLLFYTNGYFAWDRNDQLMAAFTATLPYSPMVYWTGGFMTQAALILPDPGNGDRYYVFSLGEPGQLYYSVVDMTLNGGLGDIVPGKKGTYLADRLGAKMTAVRGCDHAWLVVHGRNSNAFLSFAVGAGGIDTIPVVSTAGLLPAAAYDYGTVRCSPDGRKLAAANIGGGLELYDFDPFSGAAAAPFVLDTGRYYGACFSPDGTKLYATATYERNIYQWDLAAGSAAAVMASKTLIFANPVYYYIDMTGIYPEYPEPGELKLAPDGRIYLGNNAAYYMAMLTPAGFSYDAEALHAITQPDNAGPACAPQLHAVMLGAESHQGLPNEIVTVLPQDTLRKHYELAVCYRDSLTLEAGPGRGFTWDDGRKTAVRTVKADGVYSVTFTDPDCFYRIDTYRVRFIRLPGTEPHYYVCAGAGAGRLWTAQPPGDTTVYRYRWQDADGSLLWERWSAAGDTLKDLDTGTYSLRLSTAGGCDTTLALRLEALPSPVALFDADTVACTWEALRFTNLSAAPIWQWSFGDGGAHSTEKDPSHIYGRAGRYAASLTVTNLEGCSDTLTRDIEVRDFELSLRATEREVNKNEQIGLYTTANTDYTVLAWEPKHLFDDQGAKGQVIAADQSRTYRVSAVSAEGCTDSASVEVSVIPAVFMPSAFSPNGDGRNDRYHPVTAGDPVKVIEFRIYDRWGKQVWAAATNDPADGWDGTCGGAPAQTGTYFYQLTVETSTGRTLRLKGDLTLVR